MTATTDFGAEFTPELRKQEERLRVQSEQLKNDREEIVPAPNGERSAPCN